MSRALSVAVKSYPHTAFLRPTGVEVAGRGVELVAVDPIYKAFAPMVRELRYDLSELAIATFLQAREADAPIALLPVVLSGDFHHHSLTRWPDSVDIGPKDLVGKRVGVRAYSQTTGLWVRGILHEEFGVDAKDVTWVTTEEPHVASYVEPPNVERVSGRVLDVLGRGEVVAAVLGPPALDGAQGPLLPIIPDWRAAEEAWGARHQTVPINHMLTVRRDLLETEPDAVAGLYQAFGAQIDARKATEPEPGPRVRALRSGVTDELVAGLQIAIDYALQQEVIRTPVTAAELLDDFHRHIGGY
jgi:4,5-dihydroxyphthalate decarboxylase